MKKKLVLIIIIFTLINITACNNDKQNNNTNTKISKSEFMLNTYLTITLLGTEDETMFEPIFDKIRELENILESSIALSSGNVLMEDDLPLRIKKKKKTSKYYTTNDDLGILQTQEIEIIKNTLKRNNGHREKTANELGISRRALQYKLKKFGLV